MKNSEMVLSPMFTFQVHKFRDSQSGGGDLERNTCAKHICLRAVVADDLVEILCGFPHRYACEKRPSGPSEHLYSNNYQEIRRIA